MRPEDVDREIRRWRRLMREDKRDFLRRDPWIIYRRLWRTLRLIVRSL